MPAASRDRRGFGQAGDFLEGDIDAPGFINDKLRRWIRPNSVSHRRSAVACD
jgi:hypothetical protein